MSLDATLTPAAWMFPGHGSQYPGMAQELIDAWPRARELVEAAADHSDRPLNALRREGPPDELARADCLEPLLTAVSIAYADRLADLGGSPACVAGYSAGEVGALYAAGTLTADDALRAAVRRGRILREAAGRGRMIAVHGLAPDVVAECVATASSTDASSTDASGDEARPDSNASDETLPVEVAARNAPDHAAVAGTPEGVARVQQAVRRRGGHTTVLDVDGPWHSALATDAADALADALADLPFASPSCPVYQSTTGAPTTDPDTLRRGLARQIDTTVRWQSVAERWAHDGDDGLDDGPAVCVEVGPGRTLYGFLLRTWRTGGDTPRLAYVDDGRGRSPIARSLD